MVKPTDDYFHPRNDNPYWNESAWFSFMVPERKINGLVYFWHRPNLGLSQAGVSVWDPSGSETHNCVFHEFDTVQPLPEGANMFDFTVDCGLTVRCEEPLAKFAIDYQNPHCTLQLQWNKVIDPLAATVVAEDTLDPTCEGWGKGHYEQAGKVNGRLTVAGEQFDIDCFGVRDHSWGVRRMRHDMPRQGYEWAVASENSSFLTHAINSIPADRDDLAGTVEDQLRGWLVRDGVRSDITEGKRTVVERAPDGRPVQIVIEGVDGLGRTLHAEGTCVNALRYPCHNFWLDNWCLTEWSFDGQTAWGECQDFVQLQQNRRYVRKQLGV